MGEVFEAERLATEQTVAVKKLKPDNFTVYGLQRFVIEARALGAVDHPNVVRLLDFVPDSSDPLLVMELVDGEPLSARIKRDGPLPPDEAARLIASVARGVQAAHDVGVIHRDLKPSNLLVSQSGVPKVADFGLGKRLESDDGLTVTGHSAGGTPGYMAPEQVDPQLGEIDRRADVWGLGACLYALLTGQPPYPGGSENRYRVLSEPLVPARTRKRSVPAVLDAIVCKCLEFHPDRRYLTAAALADDLERYLRGETTVARPQLWAVRAWRRVRRTPRAVVIAWAVVFVTVAIGITAAMIPRPTPVAPEPVDELALLQKRFLAGEEVVLVPQKGLPKWHEWVVGKSDVSESPARDGSAYIRPFGVGAVKFFDPPSDGYRASVDLLHHSAQDEADEQTTWAGLMLFHHRMGSSFGAWADSFITMSYRDWDSGPWRGEQPKELPIDVGLRHKYTPAPGDRSCTDELPLPTLGVSFKPGLAPPGKWRRLVAEVTPDRVRLHWGDVADGDAGLKLVADFTAEQLNTKYRKVIKMREFIANNPPPMVDGIVITDPQLLPSQWQPTGGIGLYASRSGVAFRNMTIRRILPTPKE